MEKVKAAIARLEARRRHPQAMVFGLSADLEVIAQALAEIEHTTSLHAECLRTLAQGLKNHEASHGKTKG